MPIIVDTDDDGVTLVNPNSEMLLTKSKIPKICGKSRYVLLYEDNQYTLAYYYLNPDTDEWGFGFNIKDGFGFLPENDLTESTRIFEVSIGVKLTKEF